MEQHIVDIGVPTAEDVYSAIRLVVQDDDPSFGDVLSLRRMSAKGEFAVYVLEKPMCWIVSKSKGCYIRIKRQYVRAMEKAAIQFSLAPDGSSVRLPVESIDLFREIKPFVLTLFEATYAENSDFSFGCCSRFVECSDARQCTCPDRLKAYGCMYRKNLLSDRVFYGKNATI